MPGKPSTYTSPPLSLAAGLHELSLVSDGVDLTSPEIGIETTIPYSLYVFNLRLQSIPASPPLAGRRLRSGNLRGAGIGTFSEPGASMVGLASFGKPGRLGADPPYQWLRFLNKHER